MPKKHKALILTKYRISLPLGKGVYVAATDPLEAVKACLGGANHLNITEHSRGPRWVRYETEAELPGGWPDPKEGVTTGGGTVIDLEEHGVIKVVLDPGDLTGPGD